jgi:hypothetical protein
MEFRKLSMPEAQEAADSVGIVLPIKQDGYTLAEIFNQASPSSLRKQGKSRMGFA